MVIEDIFRVLYAPHKAFKKIIQEPKYFGPFVLLMVFVVSQVCASYIVASRSYIEQTLPGARQGDAWTENAALWQTSPGAVASNNFVDFINSTYYGNASIEFLATNVTNIWVENRWESLNGSVNCAEDGFRNVSFRVKIGAPDVKPERATLYLYSLAASSFQSDLTRIFSNATTNVWINITLPVGSESDWTRNGANAEWANITGIKIEFEWPSKQNVNLKVDGLFFRGIFKDALELYGASYIASSALNAVTPFLFQWLLLTGLIYLIIKGLKGNVVWKPLMVAVGFALVVVVVQALIILVVYTMLPTLAYTLEWLGGVEGEFLEAYHTLSASVATINEISSIIQIAVYVWIVFLGAVITHDITTQGAKDAPSLPPFGWMKSILTSAASFLLTLLISGFLLGV
ncbi:MAG: hypothetical protein QXU99_04645 [Candidatus Bathyarchaeia archaeon]